MTLPPGNDDTIELMLTPEQMLGLSQAAEVAAREPPAPLAPVASVYPIAALHTPIVPTFPVAAAAPPFIKELPAIRAARWHQTPLARMAANTLLFVAFVWWSVSQLAGQSQAHPHAAIAATMRPVAVVSHPQPAATPPPAPVQVVNPFDKTEIFQFPPGTGADESREKVAQILLQRARERQGHWEHTKPEISKPEISLRTASLTPLRKSTGPGT